MGLLDSVIGGLMGGHQGSSAMGGVLTDILGGGTPRGGVPRGGGGLGGLGALVSQFDQAGLGHVVQSWISNGPNQTISPEQLQNVFGRERVEGMAGQAGMPTGDFLSQLSQHLPNAVNGLTPNGRLPEEGTMSV
jgi:uncharacterized protein YidB (DUF937 family)